MSPAQSKLAALSGLLCALAASLADAPPKRVADPPSPEPAAPAPKVRVLRGHDQGAHSLAFSPDGKALASGGSGKAARLWDVAAGKVTRDLEGHAGAVWAVAFSPDGALLLAGSGRLNAKRDKYIDGEIRVWDAKRGTLAKTLGGVKDSLNDISFRPDGKRLATAGNDGKVILWQADGVVFQQLGILYDSHALPADAVRAGRRGDAITSAVFSPDGKLLVWPTIDGELTVWDIEAGRAKRTLARRRPGVRRVVFSRDGSMLASASDDNIKVWDVAAGKKRCTLTGHETTVFSLAFSKDGKALYSGSNDGGWSSAGIWRRGRRRRS